MNLNQPLPQLPKNLLGQLLGLPTPKRKKALATLAPVEALSLLYDWRVWARESQLPPEWLKWRICILLGGRGSGKTRAGAEWVRMMVETGKAKRISLIAATAADARDVMVEGDSGILAVCPPWNRPDYEPSKRRLTWKNGAMATLFSADEPSRLRGPQADAAWADELAFWRYPEAWDNLLLGLRLGEGPRCVVTTTPRPVALIKDLIKRDSTHVLRSTTFDNEANLATEFIDDILERYEGTRLGRQELYAELLTDTEGALWTRDVIENYRVTEMPPLKRIVVAVDPAASANENSNQTGIIVAGISASSKGDGECYVLEDSTVKASPAQWAARAVECFHRYKADRIVAEANQGGEMVRHTIATVDTAGPRVPVKLVHASRGKFTRAEPVAALYEQGKVHHVGGFAKLEDQLCTWTIDDPSPDRLDALVWAVSELMLNKPATIHTFW